MAERKRHVVFFIEIKLEIYKWSKKGGAIATVLTKEFEIGMPAIITDIKN